MTRVTAAAGSALASAAAARPSSSTTTTSAGAARRRKAATDRDRPAVSTTAPGATSPGARRDRLARVRDLVGEVAQLVEDVVAERLQLDVAPVVAVRERVRRAPRREDVAQTPLEARVVFDGRALAQVARVLLAHDEQRAPQHVADAQRARRRPHDAAADAPQPPQQHGGGAPVFRGRDALQQRARRERRLARAPDVARPQAGDEHVAAAPDVVRRVEPGLVRRGARRRRGPGECHRCCGDVGGISSLPGRRVGEAARAGATWTGSTRAAAAYAEGWIYVPRCVANVAQ